ncbi:MAG: sirohydrochlorin chelatase, partial [Actinomycetota bacterium]
MSHASSPAPPPLVLVGHGTKDPSGVAAFGAFTRRLAAAFAARGAEVAGGFIELSAPPLRDTVAGLAGRGHRHLVAVPLVLSAASHAKGDIPAALARESARHPGLRWSYGRPLGPHPVLLDLLAQRIAVRQPAFSWPSAAQLPAAQLPAAQLPAAQLPVVPSMPGAPDQPAAVLLVGRGSTDPDANAEVCKTARLLWEGRGYAFVETAFVSLAAPGVADGLERCRRLGARQIIVAQYFLFPGVLPDRIVAQARSYADAHPELEVTCT